MIVLSEVAKKLQNILNGIDSETSTIERPVSYEFVVATQGFHLDKISDKETGNNFIPVFVSSMGGEYNAIKGLKQANYNIPITLYFPIRFKDNFFILNEFLVECFVGSYLNYGTLSGKCISNISVAQYGEIQDLDLKEFQTWATSLYQREIEVKEPFMSMNFTLYLSTVGDDFVFGNALNVSLSVETPNTIMAGNKPYTRYASGDIAGPNTFTDSVYTDTAYCYKNGSDSVYTVLTVFPSYCWKKTGEHTFGNKAQCLTVASLTDSNVTLDSRTIQSQSESSSQQILGTPEAEGLPLGTAYSSGFLVYYKNIPMYEYIVEQWFNGNSQLLSFTLTMTLDNHTFQRDVYLGSCNLVANNGRPITLTFAFSKKVA